jgi:hypothetical protein
MLQTMLQAGIARTARFPVASLIHLSVWKGNSAQFGVSISPAGPRPYTKRDGGKPLLDLSHAPDCCV